jgi:hypothetical protein
MVLAWYGDGFWAFAQTLMLIADYFELPIAADLIARIALQMKILRRAPPSPAWPPRPHHPEHRRSNEAAPVRRVGARCRPSGSR